MSIKIGIIADIHATAGPLRQALEIFQREGVDLILCLGDVAGYGTELEQCIELLIETGGTTILGNHDVWFMEQNVSGLDKSIEAFFNGLPAVWESAVEGKRVFAVHASPPVLMSRGITLLDQYEKLMPDKKEQWACELQQYDLDLLLVGHTHQVFAEWLGKTLVVNPGSTAFNNTCAILSLPGLEVTTLPLSEKKVRKVWHWGMMRQSFRS